MRSVHLLLISSSSTVRGHPILTYSLFPFQPKPCFKPLYYSFFLARISRILVMSVIFRCLNSTDVASRRVQEWKVCALSGHFGRSLWEDRLRCRCSDRVDAAIKTWQNVLHEYIHIAWIRYTKNYYASVAVLTGIREILTKIGSNIMSVYQSANKFFLTIL